MLDGTKDLTEIGEDTRISNLWWNPALSGPQGIFGGRLELKREFVDGKPEEAKYGIWYDGKRLERRGPALEDDP